MKDLLTWLAMLTIAFSATIDNLADILINL